MRELLCAHEKGLASSIIPAARFLLELFAILQRTDLTLNLVSEGAPYATDRIHIFDLDLRSELGLLLRPYGHIAVAAELPLLHVGIAHSAVDQNLFQRC